MSIKKKKLTKEVYDIIRNDIPLRHKIANELRIEVNSVYQSAIRRSTKFSLPFIAKIITDHTGKKEEDIFDLEPSK